MEKHPAVYMLSNKRNGYIYIGVTSNLAVRITQHKEDQVSGFSKEHETHILVWYQYCETMETAIYNEKRMKEWSRAWKIRLIEKTNPY